jgi:hypothetical protein
MEPSQNKLALGTRHLKYFYSSECLPVTEILQNVKFSCKNDFNSLY